MKKGIPKKNTYYKLLSKTRNFLYFKVIRGLLYYSWLGRRSMFGYADTGSNFDYIYLARPKGYNLYGRLVDSILLNLPSAKATRERRNIFAELIREEICTNNVSSIKTRIVDMASGQSRYILDAVKGLNRDNVEILALDLDRMALKKGSVIAGSFPILFKKADVLKLDKLYDFSKKINWIPNIFTISGLYEYLDDLGMKKSLSDLSGYLETGGAIIFSWQVHNPNKSLLSKLGRTRSGRKWVLHYRNIETVCEWLRALNCIPQQIRLDNFHMYCVCLARKNEK
jgi:hypothetical protein